MVHDLAQFAQLRQTTRDEQEPFAFARLQATLDEQEAILEQITDFLLDAFAFACQSARLFVFGRRSAALQLGLGLGQALTLFGHRFQDPFGQFLDDMEGTKLMGHLAKDLADRLGIERRAIGRDPLERQRCASSKAVFKRPRNASISSWRGS